MSEPWDEPDLPEAAFSLTMKSGKGYDADMLTIRGMSWDQFHANASSALGAETLEGKLSGLRMIPKDAAASGPAPSSSTASQTQTGDWRSQAPSCRHGQREPREWTAKNGPNAGKAQYTYFCPQPREAPQSEKCTPVDAISGKEWGSK